MIDDITRLGATQLSAAIHARQVTCTAVMEAYLGRIHRYNPTLNAITYLRRDTDLLDEARRADQELAEQRSRGWMHGFPHAVKDLSEVAGLPTSWGSPIFANYRSTADAIHVERIRKAGAIFIGKTNTPEFGLGSHTTNPVHGPTRNPWDTTKSAGGSSGGAAAALAARLVPVADGSDMMGSLRNPAAFNGVYGFRPSAGRIPSGKGQEAFLGPLGISGPMGRTVADMAALLQTQAGYDWRDPLSLPDEDLHLRLSTMRGKRIAWFGDFGGYLRFEDGVLALDQKALDILATMGCHVETIAPEFNMEHLWQAWIVLRSFNVVHGLRHIWSDPEKRPLLGPQFQYEKALSETHTAEDIYNASVVRTQWYKYIIGLFERYDYLAMPSAQVFPFDVDLPWPQTIAGHPTDTYHRWMEVVIGPTLAGLPAVAVPAGIGANGLPNGIQLIGPPREDRSVLELAHAYEAEANIAVGCVLP